MSVDWHKCSVHAKKKQITVTTGFAPRLCVYTWYISTNDMPVSKHDNDNDDTDGSMTHQSVQEWLTLWRLVSNSHWGRWGALSILSNVCSTGHQFSHRGSEKHDDWFGTKTCHWHVFLHILLVHAGDKFIEYCHLVNWYLLWFYLIIYFVWVCFI